MFSLTEVIILLAVGMALGLAIRRLLQPQMQRAIANSPAASFRTPAQRRLHWASLLCLLPPFGYIIAVDGTHFFPVLASLAAHAAVMQVLRAVGLGYVARLWLIPVVSALSVVVGATSSTWPNVGTSPLLQAPWLLLVTTSSLVGLSTLLSIISFPLGFGERAK
jgi:hypothetical protein